MIRPCRLIIQLKGLSESTELLEILDRVPCRDELIQVYLQGVKYIVRVASVLHIPDGQQSYGASLYCVED